MRAFATLVLAISLITGGLAAASQQSESLYSRGLVQFHRGRYTEALQLFDQAVQADTKDVYALYYRGVTHGRLGDFKAEAADLRTVLGLRPDLDQAALELGVALVQTGAYRDAVTWLEQAQRVAALDPEASFFLGLTQLRLGHFDAARQNFERAAAKDPQLAVSSRYYQGVIEYQAQDWSKAREHFDHVATSSPDSEMGREARAFLTKLRAGRWQAERPYEGYAAVGLEYDSNLQFAPSDEAIKTAEGVGKQTDGRVTLGAGGAYAPWRSDRAQFSLGYQFFQSLHFDLTEFNLQDHRPSAQLVVDLGPLQFGLFSRYDYYLLETDSFLQQVTGAPWVTIPEGAVGRTELYYRMRWRDFLKQPFNGVLDAFNNSVAVRQFFYLGAVERYLFAGYRFESEDPTNQQGERFAYDGNEVSSGIGWALPAAVTTEVNYAYRHKTYAPQSLGRRDNEHQIIFVANKDLSDYLRLTLAYFGTINNSNQQLFEYDRNIVSLSLWMRF